MKKEKIFMSFKKVSMVYGFLFVLFLFVRLFNVYIYNIIFYNYVIIIECVEIYF